MDLEALRDVDVGALVVKEAVVALASQVVRLGVPARVLQQSRQGDDRVQEQILPDLAQGYIRVALQQELVRIGAISDGNWLTFHFFALLLLVPPRVEQELVALAPSQFVPQVLPIGR